MAAVARDTANKVQRKKLGYLLLAVQVVLIILFSIFSKYEDDPAVADLYDSTVIRTIGTSYTAFQNVHLMIFVGFGLLFTFLKRYTHSAVAFNLMLAAITIQWGMFLHEMFMTRGQGIMMGLKSVMSGDFAAVAVIVSFGAVLGKLSPTQLTIMALIEAVVYVFNRYIGFVLFQAVDVGSSMFVHMFGAFFGLAVARFSHQRWHKDHPQDSRTYITDLLSMIGTLFLWICLPCFNASMAHPTFQERALVNTVLSMVACTVVTCAMTIFLSKDEKFTMNYLQQATLAGGIAMGTSADMMVKPYGAMIVGLVAAVVSVLGCTHITPCFMKRLNMHDSRGVHNVHGLPGLLAGVIGIIVTALANRDKYGADMYLVFPAMTPTNVTTDLQVRNMVSNGVLDYGVERTAAEQCGFQAAAFVVSLALALLGGSITGLLLRLSLCDPPKAENVFDDLEYWAATEEGMPMYTVYVAPPPATQENGPTEETVELAPKETEQPTTEENKEKELEPEEKPE